MSMDEERAYGTAFGHQQQLCSVTHHSPSSPCVFQQSSVSNGSSQPAEMSEKGREKGRFLRICGVETC